MQHIADSKIGTIQSNPNVKYPMVRLPRECSELIGKRAQIYKTEHEGRPALLVVPYAAETARLTAKPKPNVSKTSLETKVESHLSALKSEIREVKRLLLLKEGDEFHEKLKNSGLGRIRTGDLRRVKTEDSGFSPEVLADFSERFAANLQPGETTTRNASAPSCTV